MCVGYRLKGKILREPPVESTDWARCRPIYRTFEGWCEPTTEARHWKDLPRKARIYLSAIAKMVGAPLELFPLGQGEIRRSDMAKEKTVSTVPQHVAIIMDGNGR